jgi:hypothetical protein
VIEQVADRLHGAGQAVEAAGAGARLRVLETAGLTIAAGRTAGKAVAALSPPSGRAECSAPTTCWP